MHHIKSIFWHAGEKGVKSWTKRERRIEIYCPHRNSCDFSFPHAGGVCLIDNPPPPPRPLKVKRQPSGSTWKPLNPDSFGWEITRSHQNQRRSHKKPDCAQRSYCVPKKEKKKVLQTHFGARPKWKHKHGGGVGIRLSHQRADQFDLWMNTHVVSAQSSFMGLGLNNEEAARR